MSDLQTLRRRSIALPPAKRPARSCWVGTAYETSRLLAYAGSLGRTGLHAHHAVQVVLGLEGPLTLRDAQGGQQRGLAAVIPSDAAHEIAAPAACAFMLLLNPDDPVGRRTRALDIDGRAPSWFAAGDVLVGLGITPPLDTATRLERAASAVTRELVSTAPRPAVVHPAVQRVLASLPARLDGDVRLPALAASVGLSSGRLGHLFTETVGIPLRPYVLWLRLQRAGRAMRDGASLTEAAHAAGFADSAHFSNTYRRMFGIAPSEIREQVRWVQTEVVI